ncbi:MAG: GNAT family N-acetyltransferase [Bacteroidaceae bacterium]|nr:GNAT family N-acetyltransferase [Bacteroidaceae bacterium]
MQFLFAKAKEIMRASGNMHQWNNGYPTDEQLKQDIGLGHSFIMLSDDEPVATFALIIGPDPTYKIIYNGKWIDDVMEYGTIHRIASLPQYKGIAQTAFDFAWTKVHNLRVDTHRDNTIMQHVVEKYGFKYCGIIHLANGDERLAYQKIKK